MSGVSTEIRPAGVQALELIDQLATGIGPRRPCSPAEREAAELLGARLEAAGLQPRLEEFQSVESFGLPQGVILGTALLAGVMPARWRLLRSTTAAKAAILGALDANFSRWGPSRLLASKASTNLVAEIPAAGEERRTVCLVGHLDSSRSGLMFHPAVTPHLGPVVGAAGGALAVQGGEGVLRRWSIGRRLVKGARLLVAAALALICEREVRGQDVRGANDNASGAAAAVSLGCEIAALPLENTRVVILVTGSEESGVLGMQSFLEAHDTSGWLFLNFDGVGGAAPLRYLLKEGGPMSSFNADAGLVRVAEEIAARRPELGLAGSMRSSGLPYDATPVLARGGRAISLTAIGERIPDYHAPTDTFERIDPKILADALEAGRELIRAVDRGEAD